MINCYAGAAGYTMGKRLLLFGDFMLLQYI
nr:MAG TPA: hypothetical protein [Caudoviricetes sp.]